MADFSHRHWSTRLVVRHVAELMLARGRSWQEAVPQDWFSSLIFGTVLSASIAHLPLRERETGRWFGLEDAGRLGRPVTAAAIAQSMQLPGTSVRRRTAEMAAAGLLVREAAGLSVAPRMFDDGVLTRNSAVNREHFAAALTALATADFSPAARAVASGVLALPPGVTDRSVLAFALRTFEPLTEQHGDATVATIMSAIIAANIRHVTNDPALAARFAGDDQPPGDDQRRPVAVRAIARAINIPFETVRRRVAALVAAELVIATDAGVVVPTRVLSGQRHIDYNRRIAGLFEQLLETLVALATDACVRPGLAP